MMKSRKYNSWNFNRDLNGIGSEVVLKTFEDSRMLELCTPVILPMKIMSFIKKEFRVSCSASWN
jgi:4-hydroxythreonine-4-phosphate dehydrogenase